MHPVAAETPSEWWFNALVAVKTPSRRPIRGYHAGLRIRFLKIILQKSFARKSRQNTVVVQFEKDSSNQPILGRFFAPRLFEALRESKRNFWPPVVEDLCGREDLKPRHLHAACLIEAR